MAGIYLHIPFCKQACHYCDFHFSTTRTNQGEVLEAMAEELTTRRSELNAQVVHTIYFGGGTPSLIGADPLERMLDHIRENYRVDPLAEITLEANPDDLDLVLIRRLKQMGINRLSIGIQSFRDEDLKWMNRAHEARQGEYAVKSAQDAGFSNITIDLIYAIPGMDRDAWKKNIATAVGLDVPHISAYCLTIEEKTAFGKWLKMGRMEPVSAESAEDHFFDLVEILGQAGYDHYEVSNFCKPGMQSKHNTAYWTGESYLGIGPSAHSFDGEVRSWNVSNNQKYIHGIRSGAPEREVEVLDTRTRLNEYLMTGLRTAKGIDTSHIRSTYGLDFRDHYQRRIDELLAKGQAEVEGNFLRLTTHGLLFADRIASDFFILEVH